VLLPLRETCGLVSVCPILSVCTFRQRYSSYARVRFTANIGSRVVVHDSTAACNTSGHARRKSKYAHVHMYMCICACTCHV
jgi:hypothetical protein